MVLDFNVLGIGRGAATVAGVTPGFKAKLNGHSMRVQESSLHTYRKNGYIITNITIYNIYYRIMSYKRLSRTLSEVLQWKDSITPQAIDQGHSLT
jgi:hypothetical protein